MATTTTNTATTSRNVYGSGDVLQQAKNVLGSNSGYTFIDTSLAGYKAPTAYGANDIILNQSGAVTGAGNDYVSQINKAIADAQASRPTLPTYDPQADINNINASYQAQANAITQRNQTATDIGVQNLQRTADQLQPQYQQARNQVDVANAQSQRVLQDQMAQQGILRSGKNITSEAILGASRTNALGALTTQEQQMLSDTQFKIDQLKQQGASDTNAQLADLEAQKQNTLLTANQRAFENKLSLYNSGMQASQQDLQNLITGIQFAYGVSKDQADTLFRNKQFDYQKAQDTANRNFQQAQFNYQKAQDKLKNDMAKKQLTDQEKQTAFDNNLKLKQLAEQKSARLASLAKSKSGSSAQYSASDYENRAWAQFYDAMNNGQEDTWLKNNMRNVVTGLGSNGNKVYQQMSQIVNDPIQVKKRQQIAVDRLMSNLNKSWSPLK